MKRRSFVWLLPLTVVGSVSVSCSSGEKAPEVRRTESSRQSVESSRSAPPTPARSQDDAVAAAAAPHDRPAPPAADARTVPPQPQPIPGDPRETRTTTAPASRPAQAVPQKPQEEVSNPKSLVRPEKP